MISIRPARPGEGDRIMDIWRSAVDATHGFLLPEDRIALDEMLCGFLPQARSGSRSMRPIILSPSC